MPSVDSSPISEQPSLPPSAYKKDLVLHLLLRELKEIFDNTVMTHLDEADYEKADYKNEEAGETHLDLEEEDDEEEEIEIHFDGNKVANRVLGKKAAIPNIDRERLNQDFLAFWTGPKTYDALGRVNIETLRECFAEIVAAEETYYQKKASLVTAGLTGEKDEFLQCKIVARDKIEAIAAASNDPSKVRALLEILTLDPDFNFLRFLAQTKLVLYKLIRSEPKDKQVFSPWFFEKVGNEIEKLIIAAQNEADGAKQAEFNAMASRLVNWMLLDPRFDCIDFFQKNLDILHTFLRLQRSSKSVEKPLILKRCQEKVENFKRAAEQGKMPEVEVALKQFVEAYEVASTAIGSLEAFRKKDKKEAEIQHYFAGLYQALTLQKIFVSENFSALMQTFVTVAPPSKWDKKVVKQMATITHQVSDALSLSRKGLLKMEQATVDTVLKNYNLCLQQIAVFFKAQSAAPNFGETADPALDVIIDNLFSTPPAQWSLFEIQLFTEYSSLEQRTKLYSQAKAPNVNYKLEFLKKGFNKMGEGCPFIKVIEQLQSAFKADEKPGDALGQKNASSTQDILKRQHRLQEIMTLDKVLLKTEAYLKKDIAEWTVQEFTEIAYEYNGTNRAVVQNSFGLNTADMKTLGEWLIYLKFNQRVGELRHWGEELNPALKGAQKEIWEQSGDLHFGKVIEKQIALLRQLPSADSRNEVDKKKHIEEIFNIFVATDKMLKNVTKDLQKIKEQKASPYAIEMTVNTYRDEMKESEIKFGIKFIMPWLVLIGTAVKAALIFLPVVIPVLGIGGTLVARHSLHQWEKHTRRNRVVDSVGDAVLKVTHWAVNNTQAGRREVPNVPRNEDVIISPSEVPATKSDSHLLKPEQPQQWVVGHSPGRRKRANTG